MPSKTPEEDEMGSSFGPHQQRPSLGSLLGIKSIDFPSADPAADRKVLEQLIAAPAALGVSGQQLSGMIQFAIGRKRSGAPTNSDYAGGMWEGAGDSAGGGSSEWGIKSMKDLSDEAKSLDLVLYFQLKLLINGPASEELLRLPRSYVAVVHCLFGIIGATGLNETWSAVQCMARLVTSPGDSFNDTVQEMLAVHNTFMQERISIDDIFIQLVFQIINNQNSLVGKEILDTIKKARGDGTALKPETLLRSAAKQIKDIGSATEVSAVHSVTTTVSKAEKALREQVKGLEKKCAKLQRDQINAAETTTTVKAAGRVLPKAPRFYLTADRRQDKAAGPPDSEYHQKWCGHPTGKHGWGNHTSETCSGEPYVPKPYLGKKSNYAAVTTPAASTSIAGEVAELTELAQNSSGKVRHTTTTSANILATSTATTTPNQFQQLPLTGILAAYDAARKSGDGAAVEKLKSGLRSLINSIKNRRRVIADTGAGVNLCSKKRHENSTFVTDPNHSVGIGGIGSGLRTRGRGTWNAATSVSGVSLKLKDTLFSSQATRDVVSVGGLIRKGFQCHLESVTQLSITSPAGEVFPLEIDEQNIIVFPHHTCTSIKQPMTTTSIPPVMTSSEIYLLGAQIEQAQLQVTLYLHHLCSHTRKTSLLIETLKHTKGHKFNGKVIKPHFLLAEFKCNACTHSKQTKKPLRKGGSRPFPVMITPISDSHSTNSNPGDAVTDFAQNEPLPSDISAIVPQHLMDQWRRFIRKVNGSRKSYSRFDLEKLRPGEIIMVDSKPYPVATRGGGKWYCFLAVDVKTFRGCKVDVRKKSAHGLAIQQIIVHWGLHRRPYKCTVMSDSCGSMAHVEKMCYQMHCDYCPLPVDDQSLNIAETYIKRLFDAARTTLIYIKGRVPTTFYRQIIGAVITQDNHRATTKERGYRTPLELWYSTGKPDCASLFPIGDAIVVRKNRGARTSLN